LGIGAIVITTGGETSGAGGSVDVTVGGVSSVTGDGRISVDGAAEAVSAASAGGGAGGKGASGAERLQPASMKAPRPAIVAAKV
jgi:hypothetical protein